MRRHLDGHVLGSSRTWLRVKAQLQPINSKDAIQIVGLDIVVIVFNPMRTFGCDRRSKLHG